MGAARWFPGARLNFAENLLRHRHEGTALVFRNEVGERRTLTYQALYERATRLAERLRDFGVRPGDRIAGYLPNLIETVIAMAATTAIGAIWSSASPDFGVRAAADRFGQIEPKILFAVDGYHYNGRWHECLERVVHLAERIPSIELVILIPYGETGGETRTDITVLPQGIRYADFLRGNAPSSLGDAVCGVADRSNGSEPSLGGTGAKGHRLNAAPPVAERDSFAFAQLPPDHPVYILYSSGTTGAPKAIVHSAAGTLIQHLKELCLHTDLKRDDVIFYFTTCGWMMWNWLISALAVGATILLYDGSPFHRRPDHLWQIADEEGVSILGVSAKYIAAIEGEGLSPRQTFSLQRLKTILSTGSPLSPDSFHYVYRNVGTDICLSSISGGTDIISCFALGNPTLSVYAGEIQCIGLGMDMAAYSPEGKAVYREKGELVCRSPFPSMPVGFWNDPDGQRFQAAYFNIYPNVWRHGDYLEITERDSVIIFGRSDATLNPGGVRIGTAEIYRIVEKLPGIADALAVGHHWNNDERIILFVKTEADVPLTDGMRKTISEALRREGSPRHVPYRIFQIPQIPYTINGKKVELAVRNLLRGQPPANADVLADPAVLACYRPYRELLSRADEGAE
ncbi:acetoacetate--CoA ligase [Heliobacterium gestii]|uniref:Acetoacetate--CoA ligase n=2 Tax=Heliomicrobium gestii TaxID=2699 RepID=A0A845LGI6_HELGE|nr:acetoacetate--CoA ligase [Heliomicrobium gestii]